MPGQPGAQNAQSDTNASDGARMLAPDARRVQIWLHAATVHDLGALFAIYALLLTEVVTFADYFGGDMPSSGLFEVVAAGQISIVLAHTMTTIFGAAVKRPSDVGIHLFEGDSSGDEASSFSNPPQACSWRALDIDILVGSAYTVVTLACMWHAIVDLKDVDRLGLTFVSYAMYLVHALGGSFFLSFLKSSLAGDARDVSEALEPLLRSPPLVSMTATCSHCEKRGKKSKTVVTHKAVEWVPFVSWRDITRLPQNDLHREFIQISLLIRLGTDVSQERERFERNHTMDACQLFRVRLSVAGFDSSEVWRGLWCTSAPRHAAARVAIATAFLCSVPVRLAISRRTSHLVVVVRKQVSWIATSGTLPRAQDWKTLPSVPSSKGQVGIHGWTFSRAAQHHVDPPPHPPNLTLYDYAALWSDRSPCASSVITSLTLLTEAVFAVTSSKSRLLGLICWISLPFMGFLELLRWRAFAKNVLRWPAMCTYCLAVFIILGMVVSIAALSAASLWVSVQWELATQGQPISTVRDLSPERVLNSWSFYLVDGYVDVSRKLSSHEMCGKRHNDPCRFISAAPIFESLAASQRAGAKPRAWAVSAQGYAVSNDRCELRGGLCGLVAARTFDPETMHRLRQLIVSEARFDSSPPAMVFVVNPEVYFAGTRHVVLHAGIYVALLVFLGLAASHANCRVSEWTPSRQVNIQLGATESWDAIHERSSLLEMALADTPREDCVDDV